MSISKGDRFWVPDDNADVYEVIVDDVHYTDDGRPTQVRYYDVRNNVGRTKQFESFVELVEGALKRTSRPLRVQVGKTYTLRFYGEVVVEEAIRSSDEEPRVRVKQVGSTFQITLLESVFLEQVVTAATPSKISIGGQYVLQGYGEVVVVDLRKNEISEDAVVFIKVGDNVPTTIAKRAFLARITSTFDIGADETLKVHVKPGGNYVLVNGKNVVHVVSVQGIRDDYIYFKPFGTYPFGTDRCEQKEFHQLVHQAMVALITNPSIELQLKDRGVCIVSRDPSNSRLTATSSGSKPTQFPNINALLETAVGVDVINPNKMYVSRTGEVIKGINTVGYRDVLITEFIEGVEVSTDVYAPLTIAQTITLKGYRFKVESESDTAYIVTGFIREIPKRSDQVVQRGGLKLPDKYTLIDTGYGYEIVNGVTKFTAYLQSKYKIKAKNTLLTILNTPVDLFIQFTEVLGGYRLTITSNGYPITSKNAPSDFITALNQHIRGEKNEAYPIA